MNFANVSAQSSGPAPLWWTGSYQKTFFVLDSFSIVSLPFSGEAEVQSDRPKAGQKSVPKNGSHVRAASL